MDFFKEISDNLGQYAGGQRIIQMSDFLKTIKYVEAFRYGGDEFILVLQSKRVVRKVNSSEKY